MRTRFLPDGSRVDVIESKTFPRRVLSLLHRDASGEPCQEFRLHNRGMQWRRVETSGSGALLGKWVPAASSWNAIDRTVRDAVMQMFGLDGRLTPPTPPEAT